MSKKRLVIGVGGASGAIYADRLFQYFKHSGKGASWEPHVVFSRMGRLVWRDEIGTDPKEYGFPIYATNDMTAPFASGSAGFDAMTIVPCSAGCLGRVAGGISADLIGRAADVMLKEGRPLVLVLRENPYSLIQIRNMATVTEAGACVMPATPSFYSQPRTIDDLADTVVARLLDRLGIDNDVSPRWSGRGSCGVSPAVPELATEDSKC